LVDRGTTPASVPFEPLARNAPSKGIGSRFKIVAFNARGGKHFEAIVEHLRTPPLAGASVILLCELDWRLTRSRMREIAAELGGRLSMSYAFAPEFGFPRRDGITSFLGNAILSAEPLQDLKVVPITSLYDWTQRHPGDVKDVRAIGARNALIAAINVGQIRMTLGVIHLERLTDPAGRADQMQELLDAIPQEGAAIIGGDFNTTSADLRGRFGLARLAVQTMRERNRLRAPEPYEPLFGRLVDAGFSLRDANVALAPTFRLATMIPRFVRPKLDWIALRQLKAVAGSARVVRATRSWARSTSDHDFISCEVEL
jgi:endonuclease/exonuclease/phosphatase family metal-dependent hydrolase